MAKNIHTELAFEEAIEDVLINNSGYVKGDPDHYNKDYAVDEKLLFQFLQTSQPNKWGKLETIQRSGRIPYNPLPARMHSSVRSFLSRMWSWKNFMCMGDYY